MSASKNVETRATVWRACRAVLLAVPLTILLVACGQENDANANTDGEMPPAEVGMIVVAPQAVALRTELPGRLEASRVAQVRARVAGILLKRSFVEGSDVKAGQPLFQIDPAPYEATLASAKAMLARSQANLTQARAQAQRYKPLVAANAISKQDYINAVSAQKQAEADVAAGQAAVKSAQINLGYAAVRSPLAGHIGRALVTEGALVGQGEATPLALVQQIDPLYVNFTQSTAEVLRLRKAVASGQFERARVDGASVHLVLEDGSVYEHPGKLLFSDLSVDPSSGQISLRATVPNPAGLLLPGMYVRVRLEQAQASAGVLLPQQAVTRGSTGDTVMVVGLDGKVSTRPVKIGTSQDGKWVVLDGLAAGEQVMVDGFQKLRADAPVKAVPWRSGAGAPDSAGPKSGAPDSGAPDSGAPDSGGPDSVKTSKPGSLASDR